MRVEIRASGFELDTHEREHVLRSVHLGIGRHAPDLCAVGATLRSIDSSWWLCTVGLRRRGRPPLIVEGSDATLRGAAARALGRAERELRRTRRRRTRTEQRPPRPVGVT